jgi:hypothetical protein
MTSDSNLVLISNTCVRHFYKKYEYSPLVYTVSSVSFKLTTLDNGYIKQTTTKNTQIAADDDDEC